MITEKVKIVDREVFDIFTIELREDGILHRHVSEKAEYNVKLINGLNAVIGKMVNYCPVPVLITIDDNVTFPSDVRSFRANKDILPSLSRIQLSPGIFFPLV
jgi:hypothetical protein